MLAHKKNLLAMAVALAVTACGGGGGGSDPAALTSSSGKAVDGYLSASSVLCDTNNNDVADAGETVVTTNGQGDFTFSPSCASTIVVSGGTNIDTGVPFKGLLKAPAGSAVASPLTTLMVSEGFTAAQVATAMGLPAGTDVSKTDPMVNVELQKKTLAIQQIIQQVTDTLGGMAGSNNTNAIHAIYSEVAKAIVATLLANPTTPLVDASGNVSPILISDIVKQSASNVSNSNSPALVPAKAALGNFSGVSVAELVSGAIAAQATLLVNVSAAGLVAQATSLQSNPTIPNVAFQVSSLLTTAAAKTGGLSGTGAALQQLIANNDAAASSALTAAVIAQALAVNITAPTINVSALSTPSNYLAIQDDTVNLNGVPYTLSQFMSGATLTARPETVDFSYELKGAPIPAGGSQVSVGMEITEIGTGRVLQVILDHVDLTVANGQLSATVPAGAQMNAYGKSSNGTTANLSFSNISADHLISTAGNHLSFNAGNVLDKLANKVGTQSDTQASSAFASLQELKGTFNLKVVVSNLTIQAQTSASAIKSMSVGVTGSSMPPVSGLGIEGKFTVN